MDEIRRDIADLEERIERLTGQREGCRKVAVAAKAAIGAGAALLIALVLGLFGSNVLWLLVAAILLLGGFVLAGSNARTADDLSAQIAKAERLRTDLIGEIELTLVPQTSRLLH